MNKNKNNQLVDNLKKHVYKLSEEIGERSMFKYEALKQAQNYILHQFALLDYDPQLQGYPVEGEMAYNIIATRKGEKYPGETIIVGAHYDTCFNPGADDNASGVAIMLELARFFSKQQSQRTIKFIAFVNEEPPFFKSSRMGSLYYVREAKRKREKIKAALILESVGYYTNKPHSQQYPPFLRFFYPDKGNFICVVGNFSSGWLVKEVVSYFKKKLIFPLNTLSERQLFLA